MQTRNYWVDIEDSSGNRIGRGPLRATNFRHDARLSASGDFSFTVYGSDPNLSALGEKRVAVCKYIDHSGALQTFGGGVIDKITRVIEADGRLVINVSGNDLVRELTNRTVGSLDLSGVGGAGVTDAPDQVMALAPAGWTINDGTTLTSVYAGYAGELVLSALIGVGEPIGEHWRLGSGRVIEWLGPASTFVASGVRAVQHVNDPVAAETVDTIALITSFEEVSDAADLLSRVIPRGAGNGGAVLTLAAVTDSAPVGYTLNAAQNYLKRDDTETQYGRIERVLDFKNIKPLSNTTADIQAAANMLLQASLEHLRKNGAPQKFYRVGLSKVGQLLQPGTTLRTVYRNLTDGAVVYDVDATFIILEATREINEAGMTTTSVLISTIDRMPISDSDYLARQAMGARILSAHQQLGASVDTFTYRDEMDDAKDASFRFWLGDEYTSIQRAVMRFRIQPLRSTVKSVAGSSTTTSSGGGSTSGSGGSSSPTTASGGTHDHQVTSIPTTGSPSTLYTNAGNLYNASGTPKTFRTDMEAVGHSHSVTIPAHTHSTPDHTHSLTPNISMEYGIFEESGANTLALANLVIKLNGGADLNASVDDIGNGWYELDITADLVDAVFRPTQENNEVVISTATAKTARIEAQITIRGVVQAVAYS